MKYLQPIAVTLVLALLMPSLCAADPSFMAVGAEGTVLKVRSDSYAALFPGESLVGPDNQVLALDVLRPSGVERFLVPETDNQAAEDVAALHFEKDSGLTHVLWEGLLNGVHPYLYLASFDGTAWTETIPITASVYADKGSAHLVIMPESDLKPKTGAGGGLMTVEMPAKRTVMYVAWQEGAPAGLETFLAPVILEDGQYLGWRKILNLSSFVEGKGLLGGAKSVSPRAVLDPNLRDMLAIQPSAKGNAVSLGFINRETGRFEALEFEFLPLALSAMAERVKELLVEHSETSSTVTELIERVQNDMLNEGADFHLGVLEYLANRLGELLADRPTVAAAAAPRMLEKVGIMMIDIGARVRRKGLVDLEPLGIYALGQTAVGGAPYHYLKVSLLAERDAPVVDGLASLFLSRTGEKALVAWVDEDIVYYRESTDDAWEETQQVQLREGLDQATVYRILSERTLNR